MTAEGETGGVAGRNVRLPSGTWVLDPQLSTIEFQVVAMGVVAVKGFFLDFEGELTIEQAGQLRAVGRVRTASLDTRDAERDAALLAPKLLDGQRFPEIEFESLRSEPVEPDTLLVTGRLSIRGVSKEARFRVRYTGVAADPWVEQRRLGLEARAEISRTDFGMPFDEKLENGTQMVADRVRLVAILSALPKG